MNRYDEKVYRVPRKKEGPSLAEQKSQLFRLKQDLEQFKARQAGAAVVGSLRERIRDLEASIARAEAARNTDRPRRSVEDGAEANDGGDGGGNNGGAGGPGTVRSTSSRFPPRGRPGRSV